MKKFFMLVIVILAFFTIDHPSVKEPREQLLKQGIGFLSSTTKVERFPLAAMTREKISNQLVLSTPEQNYINDTFTTDQSVAAFELQYCRRGEMNLHFYAERLTTVCRIINSVLAQQRVK